MQSSVIPSFFLYGESPRTISDRFLHLEDLDVRSRPSEWNIRPHAHANLNHLFHIAAGAGTMRAEAQALVFAAPCLLVVPAKVVHGFRFDPDTCGSVLTIADSYLDDLFRREPDLAPLLERPASVALEDSERFADDLRRLSRELAWKAPRPRRRDRRASPQRPRRCPALRASRRGRFGARPRTAGPSSSPDSGR